MIRSGTNPEPFNRSCEMVSVNASRYERATTCPFEVIFTARVADGPVWTATMAIPSPADTTCLVLNRLQT
jgi:hypothetical protein